MRLTEEPAIRAATVCSAVGLETGSAAQGHIGLHDGDAKLLGGSLEYVQRTATQILNAIGADDSSVPPAKGQAVPNCPFAGPKKESLTSEI